MSAFIEAASYGVFPGNDPVLNANGYNAAVQAAQDGNQTLIPAPGPINTGGTINITRALKIDGSGYHDGGAWRTAINPIGDFPAFLLRTNEPVIIKDLGIIRASTCQSGAIDVDGSVTNYDSKFSGLRISGGVGFRLRKTSNFHIKECSLDNIVNAVLAEQTGDSWIKDNKVTGCSGSAFKFLPSGNWAGLMIDNNKINGALNGFDGVWGNYNDGDLKINGNSFEGITQAGVIIQRGGTGQFGTVVIAGNTDICGVRAIHIPTDPRYTVAEGPWLNDVIISSNVLVGSTASVDIDCVGGGTFIATTTKGGPIGVIVSRKCRNWVIDKSRIAPSQSNDFTGYNTRMYSLVPAF